MPTLNSPLPAAGRYPGALDGLASRLDFQSLLDQHGRMLRIETALPSLALIPERTVWTEGLSMPFELTIDCLSSSVAFELKHLVGEQVSVRLLQPDGRYRPIHGYVFSAAQLGGDGGLARYRLVMRPWLAFLGQRRDSFIFQDLDALQVIESVFADHPSAHYRFDVTETLRVRSLCTQYQETDLAFVQRLLAEEGLSYHFEHLDDDAAASADATAQARHVLVVTDRWATRPDLGDARFAVQHVSANVEGQKDAVTAFAAERGVESNAVALGAWDYRKLAGTAGSADSALARGDIGRLEHYDGAGAYRYESTAHAQRAADLALLAHELQFKRFEGQGSTRHFESGRRFDLIDHPLYGANTTAFDDPGALLASHQRPDNAFVLMAVEHHASNNLGAQAARLFGASELERGTYKNHFHAVPAAAAIVPGFLRKPTARGMQTAIVVGLQGEELTTDRDHRVKLQFPWQRGERPLPGGLPHDQSPTTDDPRGNAPGDERSGTWVRVALPSAGANWGSVFTPRIGTEVLVDYVEADIDRPLIVGQLYNGQDLPPFSAGVDSGVNHPGVLSGLHTEQLEEDGFNQWTIDDATGQLRMRLMTSYATSELGLGHLIQQPARGAQRGAWRGSGFEAGTHGWASLRATRGILLTTTARAGTYGSAESTQMDSAEAIAQLKGARDLGQRLGQAASAAGAHDLHTHDDGKTNEAFIKTLDPAQQGRHDATVNGQEARKAEGRELTDPVEASATPTVVLDSPSHQLIASEASVVSFSGEHLSVVAQGDVQHTAAHTYASVSGQTTSFYTFQGGIQATAANGPVSIRAHTDALQILSDQEITVTSVDDEIVIQAATKVELIGGKSGITFEGGDITFRCPGTFWAKGSMRAFLGGEACPAALQDLPFPLVNPVKAPYSLRWKVVGAVDGRPSQDVDVLARGLLEQRASLDLKTGADGRSDRQRDEKQPKDFVSWAGSGEWSFDIDDGLTPTPYEYLDWFDNEAVGREELGQ